MNQQLFQSSFGADFEKLVRTYRAAYRASLEAQPGYPDTARDRAAAAVEASVQTELDLLDGCPLAEEHRELFGRLVSAEISANVHPMPAETPLAYLKLRQMREEVQGRFRKAMLEYFEASVRCADACAEAAFRPAP